LVQASWAGDKATMTKKAIASVQQAAAEGAKVVCLQELFNGPYFCQVQEPE
jgi:N-carbamoylputrescine amidase